MSATIENASALAGKLNAAHELRKEAHGVLSDIGMLGKVVFKNACAGYTSIMIRDVNAADIKKAEKQKVSLALLKKDGYTLLRIAEGDKWFHLDWSIAKTGRAADNSSRKFAQTLTSMAPHIAQIKEVLKPLRKFRSPIVKAALSGYTTIRVRNNGTDKWAQDLRTAKAAGFKIHNVRGATNEFLIQWSGKKGSVPTMDLAPVDEEEVEDGDDDEEEVEDGDDDEDDDME